MTRLSVAILTTLGIVPAAAAQAPARWKHRVLPYVTVLGGHRPAIGAAVRAWRPEDSSARVPSAGELFLGGGIGLRGVGRAEGRFRLPAAGRYRLAVIGRGSWMDRPLFTGVGNATVFDRSFEKGGRPDFYRVSLDRMNGRVEATRWLGRRFGVAANVGFDRATFTALPGTTMGTEPR